MQNPGSPIRFPPSPESAALSPASQPSVPGYLTLEQQVEQQPGRGSRLRSIARYRNFHPQVIACSIPSSLSLSPEGGAGRKLEPPPKGSSRRSISRYRDDSSLIAIAGPDGVLLTRSSHPQTPLAVLSHTSPASSPKSSISCLAFQPPSLADSSLLLAAGRGSGVLIWDATGHSLSPLIGRLGLDISTAYSDLRVTSLDWKKGPDPVLATTVASFAYVWDLRTALGPTPSRPSHRFGSPNGSSLIQVACSEREEFATLDRTGIVRIYDARMSARSPSVGSPASKSDKGGELLSFMAFANTGVGMAHFRSSSHSTSWVTWGVDDPCAPALVKVWSKADTHTATKAESDDESYSLTEGSTTKVFLANETTKEVMNEYRQVAQLGTPGLSCARVCPSPFVDQLVTVGIQPEIDGDSSCFQADVWLFSPNKEKYYTDIGELRVDTFGVEKITSFQGGGAKDKKLQSTLGSDAKMGQLRGVDLILDTLPVNLGKSSRRSASASKNVKLQLCCLSDDGIITSYALTEEVHNHGSSTSPVSSDSLPLRRQEAEETRIYSDLSKEATMFDAATALQTWSKPPTMGLQDDESQGVVDSVLTQFQLDVQAPFGTPSSAAPVVGAIDASFVSSDQAAANPSVMIESNEDAVEVGLEHVKTIVASIDKGRVPCPRLCGASFSAGTGGIICFRNGEIGKMWSWYQESTPSSKRRAHQSSGDESGGLSRPLADDGKELSSLFGRGDSMAVDGQKNMQQQSPRTLKDLDNMVSAAKKAQWKDNLDSGEASDESEGSASIFDDSSDGSSLSDDSDYEKQSTPRKQNLSKSGGNDSIGDAPTVDLTKTLIGPSSDLLAPFVSITLEHDDVAFSKQCVELAEGWLLGTWYFEEDENGSFISPDADSSAESTKKSAHRASKSEIPSAKRSSSDQPDTSLMLRMKSDPMLAHLTPRSPGGRKTYGLPSDDDAPVRGGEYSVRPNRQESMVFLKKLFKGPEAPTLLSPPDEPLLPKKISPPRALPRVSSTAAVMQTTSPTTVVEKDRTEAVGVRTLSSNPMTNVIDTSARRRNLRTRDICLHNADICVAVGQDEKADTWLILAQLIDNTLHYDGDAFNGWSGPNGGALGHELVASLLEYYEHRGDVQMVSSVVCVLGQGQCANGNHVKSRSLVPYGEGEKYDSFMRCYADILFAWGLLTTRAELLKFLTHASPDLGEGQIYQVPPENADTGTPGVVVFTKCTRCKKETSAGNIMCQNCKSFAFRCTLCDNPVKGLFTVCWLCGHGGHTSHILTWFENHRTCPSGCGCACVLQKITPDGTPKVEAVAIPTADPANAAEEKLLLSASDGLSTLAVA